MTIKIQMTVVVLNDSKLKTNSLSTFDFPSNSISNGRESLTLGFLADMFISSLVLGRGVRSI